MKCFLVLMYVVKLVFLCFSDCHVVINMHYFIGLVIISACVKCFNIDLCIYGTLLLLPFFLLLFHPGFFVMLILMYTFIVLVLF